MRDLILVLNMQADYARDIALKLRREGFFCCLVPREISIEEVREIDPSGLILADGIDGVQHGTAMDMRLLELGLPVLALGESAVEINQFLGGETGDTNRIQEALRVTYAGESPLFAGLESSDYWFEQLPHWQLAQALAAVAWAPEDRAVGYAHLLHPLYGLLFQIEQNDPGGVALLRNFAQEICGATPWWTPDAMIERGLSAIGEQAGEGKALCLVSGGLDSAVCARLCSRAVGERTVCVMIDTGLNREGEVEEVQRLYQEEMGLPVVVLDAQADTLKALFGVTDSLSKTRAVADVYEKAVSRYAREQGEITLLVQGTNYSDLTYRGALSEEVGASACEGLAVVEPLRELFKEEVRELGRLLEMPESLQERQSFPSAGLALRLTGPVDPARIALLRKADQIVTEEIQQSGQSRRLVKYFAVMAPMPEGQAPGEAIVVRAVQHSESDAYPARLPYDVLERIVERVLAEVEGVERVVYDITAGDNTKIEWT